MPYLRRRAIDRIALAVSARPRVAARRNWELPVGPFLRASTRMALLEHARQVEEVELWRYRRRLLLRARTPATPSSISRIRASRAGRIRPDLGRQLDRAGRADRKTAMFGIGGVAASGCARTRLTHGTPIMDPAPARRCRGRIRRGNEQGSGEDRQAANNKATARARADASRSLGARRRERRGSSWKLLNGPNMAPRGWAGEPCGPYLLSMRKGAGIGFAMVLVVVAIVLVLWARAWKSVEPTAQQVMHGGRGAKVSAHGQTEAAEAIRKKELPDLEDMKRGTDDHAKRSGSPESHGRLSSPRARRALDFRSSHEMRPAAVGRSRASADR